MVLAAALLDAAEPEAAEAGADPEALAVLPEPEEQPTSVAAIAAVAPAPAPINPRRVMFFMLFFPSLGIYSIGMLKGPVKAKKASCLALDITGIIANADGCR